MEQKTNLKENSHYDTYLISRFKLLGRGPKSFTVIRDELIRLNLMRSEMTPYAYYFLTFKLWKKDFVLHSLVDILKGIDLNGWESTTDVDIFIIMNVLTEKIVIK